MITDEIFNEVAFIFDEFVDATFQDSVIDSEKININSSGIEISFREKIVFLDIKKFMKFCYIKKPTTHHYLEHGLYGKESFEIIKLFKLIINGNHYFSEQKKGETFEFEVRFINFRNFFKFSAINSEYEGKLVTLRGVVFNRWDETKQYVTKKKWSCMSCGAIQFQHIDKYFKPPKYKAQCTCGERRWKFMSNTEYEDFFRIRIEALSEDTPSKLEFPTFTVEFTHNFCNEKILDSVINGVAYEFTGFINLIPLDSQKQDGIYRPFMEVMTFQQIEKQQNKIILSAKEKQKLKSFLSDKNSINKLTNMFAQRVIGFQREKKFFIIAKALQENFNTKETHVKAKDFLLHLLLVGDYSTGKSEFAEACLDICENGYYIIGSSTSGAGLTGITERDELTGFYTIQTGILARASGDFLVIEEFDKSRDKSEFGVINEAMSKYQYTITKAGKSRKFKCNTSIIIVANPIKKRFDTSLSLIPQIDIGGDLLSRFTVISCKLTDDDIEKQLKIDKILLSRADEEVIKQDLLNSEYIKRCIKLSSEINVSMNNPIVETFLNNFTKETYTIKNSTSGEDKRFWENMGMPRNRQSLLKLIKGVAILHLHETPTLEDMNEAKELFFEFQKEVMMNPSMLNTDEFIISGSSKFAQSKLDSIESSSKWDLNDSDNKKNISNKQDLLYEYILELMKEDFDSIVEIETLIMKSIQKFNALRLDIENILKIMKKDGIIFEPKSGFIKTL